MKKTKYLGMKSGDWTCTRVDVDYIQSAYTQKRDEHGRKIRSKYPGHRLYSYTFERATSDAKAIKTIKLSCVQARRVLNGERDVEYYAEKKQRMANQSTRTKVSYSFITAAC